MRIILTAAVLILTSNAFATEYMSPPSNELQFPADFKWCVSTAAHQIEGNNVHSDWWQWEQIPGKIKNGDSSGLATDSWNRWREDLEMVRTLNANEYRFSLEWAKIEPQEGVWDESAIEHYRQQIVTMRQMGITPLVTIHHFTNPAWFSEKGGWEWAGAPNAFDKYTRKVATALGGQVTDWITFNEPTVFLAAAYIDGIFPPGKHGGIPDFIAPLRGMLKSHALAYKALHELIPGARVGVAHHLRVFDPKNPWSPLDIAATHNLDRLFNGDFMTALETGYMDIKFTVLNMKIPFMITTYEKIPGLRNTQDFIGVNYYTRDMVSFDMNSATHIARSTNPDAEVNDLGWEIYPEGLTRTLRAVAERVPNKDILITENGIADATDAKRPEYLRTHLLAVQTAMREGIRVKGYCHWSLLDNFEWAEGFTPRFGLYEVNRVTLNRTLRPSGRFFAEIAGRSNPQVATGK